MCICACAYVHALVVDDLAPVLRTTILVGEGRAEEEILLLQRGGRRRREVDEPWPVGRCRGEAHLCACACDHVHVHVHVHVHAHVHAHVTMAVGVSRPTLAMAVRVPSYETHGSVSPL